MSNFYFVPGTYGPPVLVTCQVTWKGVNYLILSLKTHFLEVWQLGTILLRKITHFRASQGGGQEMSTFFL